MAAAPRQPRQLTLLFTLYLCWSLRHSPGEGGRTELAKFAESDIEKRRQSGTFLEVFDTAGNAAPAASSAVHAAPTNRADSAGCALENAAGWQATTSERREA